MNYPQSTYHSKVYRDFRAIEASDWRTIVHFYEECEKEIIGLEFEEYFELLLAYTNALFETGSYQKHLLMADVVIEASVMNNVKFFNGEDVFHKTLFKKAASCYHIHQLEKADYILRELLKINPDDSDSAGFLKKCLHKMYPAFVSQTRAVAIVLFLLSAIIICGEVLVVRNFFPDYESMVEVTRSATFVLGCFVLAGGDLVHRWQANREVEVFVRNIRRRKKR